MARLKGTTETFDGSPLRMLKLENQFTHYVFVDVDLKHLQVLEERISGLVAPERVRMLHVDCNQPEVIRQILDSVASSALAFMFVDPFAFNIKFDTLAALTKGRRIDILVNFQTVGVRRATKAPPQKINDLFGDDGAWQHVYNSSPDPTEAVLNHYGQRLSALDYLHDPQTLVPVRDVRNIVLYYLLFASKNELGTRFWKDTVARAGWRLL